MGKFELYLEMTSAPAKLACVSSDLSLHYAELLDRRAALGGALSEHGVTRGSVVLVFGRRSVESVVALLAIEAAGATYVPLDIEGPVLRQRQIIAGVRPLLAVAASGLREKAAEVVAGACPVVAMTDLAGRSSRPAVRPGDDDLAYVIFTSGSTGQPKGVAVTHGNVAALARARREVFGTGSVTVLLTWPLVFDGSVAAMQWAFGCSGTLVIASDDEVRDVHRLAELIEQHSVTHLLMVPALYGPLLEARHDSLAAVRAVTVAGDVVPPGLVRRHFQLLPHVRLVNEYGPTECTVWSTYHELSPADGEHANVPIGRPVPGVHAHVIDEQGELAGSAAVGELVIGGDTVASGYIADAALTGRRFRPDRWCGTGRVYLTGDLVSESADGILSFVRRRDDQVKISGHRVEPGEVEAALYQHGSVAAAAVVAAALPGGRRALIGYVQLSAGELAAEAELREFLRDRIAGYMMPLRVMVLDRLPATHAGKPDRQALAARAASDLAPGTPVAGPGGRGSGRA